MMVQRTVARTKDGQFLKNPEPKKIIYDGEHTFSLVMYVNDYYGKIIYSGQFYYSQLDHQSRKKHCTFSMCEIFNMLSNAANLDDLIDDIDSISSLESVRLILLCDDHYVEEVKTKVRVDYEFERVFYADKLRSE